MWLVGSSWCSTNEMLRNLTMERVTISRRAFLSGGAAAFGSLSHDEVRRIYEAGRKGIELGELLRPTH